MEFIEFLLTILFVILAVNVIVFAAKNIRIPVLADITDFEIKYKKTFLYTAFIFFLAVAMIVIKCIVFFRFSLFDIILIAVLACAGLPFLFMTLLFKIRVTSEHLIFKRTILKYDDIKYVAVNKYYIFISTKNKTYKFLNNVDYKEELLLVLSNKGIEVLRKDI